MSLLFIMFVFLSVGIGVLLSILIMVQESKSLGLGASFGGDSSSSLFGSSTAAVIKKITGYLAATFVVCVLLITYWSHGLSKAPSQREVEIESVQESVAEVEADLAE